MRISLILRLAKIPNSNITNPFSGKPITNIGRNKSSNILQLILDNYFPKIDNKNKLNKIEIITKSN